MDFFAYPRVQADEIENLRRQVESERGQRRYLELLTSRLLSEIAVRDGVSVQVVTQRYMMGYDATEGSE